METMTAELADMEELLKVAKELAAKKSGKEKKK